MRNEATDTTTRSALAEDFICKPGEICSKRQVFCTGPGCRQADSPLLIRRSLKTTVLSVAKLKLADFEKGERAKAEAHGRVLDGKATVGDLIVEYKTRLETNHSIKKRTRDYYQERLAALLKSWPEPENLDVRRVLREQCRK